MRFCFCRWVTSGLNPPLGPARLAKDLAPEAVFQGPLLLHWPMCLSFASEQGTVSLPTLFLFFKTVLLILVPLPFHINSRTSLSTTVSNTEPSDPQTCIYTF